MSSRAELRPPPPADEAGASRSLLADIWATISTDEFAGRVLVTAAVILAVGWLGIKEAVGAVLVSQVLTEAVKSFIRRRQLSRKKIWLLSLLLLLFQLAQRAWAAVAKRFRPKRAHESLRPQGARNAAIMSATVAVFTVAAITVPEVAVGHQLVGHRDTTFFSTENGGGSLAALKLSLPHPETVEATGADGAQVRYSATATRGVVNCSRASGSIFPIGTTQVRCVARTPKASLAGTFTVRVADREAPTLRLPTRIDRKILGNSLALAFVAKAHDRVDGSAPVHCSPPSGAVYELGKTTVRCRAVDKHGNHASRSFVVDLRHPPPGAVVFKVPSNPIVEATGPNGAIVTYNASANDATGRALPLTCSPRSGSVFAIGTHTVACSAGPSGDVQQQTFSVSVRDTTGPTLQVPSNFDVEADSKSGAVVTYNATGSDKVSGNVNVSCNPASGTALTIGSHSVTCTGRDAANNVARRSFGVQVFDGVPTLTVPADITRDYTKPPGAIVRYRPTTATDKIDGTLTPECAPPSGSLFRVGTTTVTCEVTDSGGNHVSSSFTITILDRIAPVLRVPASLIAYAPYTGNTAVVTFNASAYDAIDRVVPVSCKPPSGSELPIGRTTVTCTATDHSGNTATKSFVVTVRPGIE